MCEKTRMVVLCFFSHCWCQCSLCELLKSGHNFFFWINLISVIQSCMCTAFTVTGVFCIFTTSVSKEIVHYSKFTKGRVKLRTCDVNHSLVDSQQEINEVFRFLNVGDDENE